MSQFLWVLVVIATTITRQQKTMFGVMGGTPPGGTAIIYMSYIGMCCCEGYGFQAVHSSIGYTNQSVWV